MLDKTSYFDAIVTLCCSYLSLIGSSLVLLSYLVVKSKHTPKPAYLILHLALSDFIWFMSSSVQASFWLFSSSGTVPNGLCYIASPIVAFTRMASLIWTCVISFNVLMSVQKRKWSWAQNATWDTYRKLYFVLIFLFASPAALLSIVHGIKNEGFGCQPGYEPIGLWYEVIFSELVPITVAFLGNIYVFLHVRQKMSKSAYPQSVRKRRKRIMYNYVVICIVCWFPTIVDYAAELSGFNSPNLEILARTSLYISGFLNFLVFGMQDPHLKRSFIVIVKSVGLTCFLPYSHNDLRQSAVEKTVMFQEETINTNADLSKDRKSMYKYHKLSLEDKQLLYADRPDLNPKVPLYIGSPQKKYAHHNTSNIVQPLLSSEQFSSSVENVLHPQSDSSPPSPSTSAEFSKREAHLKMQHMNPHAPIENRLSAVSETAIAGQVDLLVDNHTRDDSDSSSGDEEDEEDMDLSSPV